MGNEGEVICGVITTELISRHKDKRELPDGWRWMKLGDVCEIVAPQVDPKIPKYGSLPHVSGENIEGGACRLTHLKTAAEDGMTSGKYFFDPGDVLYSKLRPYLRKAVVVDFQGLCSADMYPIKVNQDFLDPHFTAWMLVSEEFTTYADAQSRRARMPKLNRDELFAWNAPLPPLDEQKRIAAILNEQMEAVKRSRQATLVQLEAAQALPAAYLRAVFNSPEAQKWERKLLGEVCNISTGTTPSTEKTDYYKGNIPFVKTAEVVNNRITKTQICISQQAVEDYRLKLYPPGTVLMAMYGQGKTRGQVAILDIAATTTQNAAAIVPEQSLDSEYLWIWLRGQYLKLRQMGYQGDLSHLSLKYVKELKIPFPSITEQKLIVRKLFEQVAGAEQLHKSLEAQLNAITNLPATLLRRAFNGELSTNITFNH